MFRLSTIICPVLFVIITVFEVSSRKKEEFNFITGHKLLQVIVKKVKSQSITVIQIGS